MSRPASRLAIIRRLSAAKELAAEQASRLIEGPDEGGAQPILALQQVVNEVMRVIRDASVAPVARHRETPTGSVAVLRWSRLAVVLAS